MTWWQLTMMVLCAFGFGLLWGLDLGRTVERLRRSAFRRRRRFVAPHEVAASQPAQIEIQRAAMLVEITLCGTAVKTNMYVAPEQLEHLANGIGKTLTPMPSTEVH